MVLPSLIFFSKSVCLLLFFFLFFFFGSNRKVSSSLDPDHAVGPDLGPNCLQRLSADGTSK